MLQHFYNYNRSAERSSYLSTLLSENFVPPCTEGYIYIKTWGLIFGNGLPKPTGSTWTGLAYLPASITQACRQHSSLLVQVLEGCLLSETFTHDI